MDHELNELHREWRQSVSSALTDLRQQSMETLKELNDIKREFAQNHEVQELEKRVDILEKYRAKMVGIIIGVQIVGGGALWLINKVL